MRKMNAYLGLVPKLKESGEIAHMQAISSGLREKQQENQAI
jgi:hypothetical protein